MILDFGYVCMEFQVNLKDSFIIPCISESESHTFHPGGSATNQAIAAARSGAKISLGGTVGNDLFGKTIMEALRREGIQTPAIATSELPTGIIHSVIDSDNQKGTIFSAGANVESSADQIPKGTLNERVLLLLQNDFPALTNLRILRHAKRHNARSIMTIANRDNISADLLDELDILIIDENTLSTFCRQFSVSDEDGPQILAEKHKLYFVVTHKDGYAGASATNKTGEVTKQGAVSKKKVINKGSVFDSFCGTFAACVQASMSLPKSLEYATCAATITATKSTEHNAFPYLGDIEELVS